jgi:uroporphyrinogen decarboxylase
MNFDAVCCGVKFNKVRENPDGTYTDEWGVLFGSSSQVIDHPIVGPIRTRDGLKHYVPPDPDAPHRLGSLPEVVERFKNKKAIFFLQRVAFMWSAFLNGIDNLLMNFLLEPQFAHDLLDTVLAVNMMIARNALRAGADVIVLSDDYAGNESLFFSPAVFRTFLLPRLKRMVDAIHDEGGKAVKHSDGNLWPILDDIVNTGIDGLHPLEPVAGMDLAEVKQKYGDRVCLIGNVDCGYVLSEGSLEEVEAAVKECMRKGAPGGGYIISSSNSIHSSVKPENYLAMIAATQKYGKYPIDLAALGG